jgi:hypothetical protein
MKYGSKYACSGTPFLAIMLLFHLLSPVDIYAQAGNTDIWLLDVGFRGNQIMFENPENITDRKGYDNQPCFSPDGLYLLYSSIDDDKQADIYRYEIPSGLMHRLTFTGESEYSPIITPDGRFFSCVRVERDTTQQRVWVYPLPEEDSKGEEVLIEDVNQVGYYCWLDRKNLAMFVRGDKPTLQTTHVVKNRSSIIAQNIGRTMQMIPGTNKLSYIAKESDGRSYLYQWDPETGRATSIVEALDGGEDYCWAPTGYLLMGKGSRLYRFSPGRDMAWQPIADLSEYGIHEFQRLTMNSTGTRIAIVVPRQD